jgi:hypothetical protein
MRLSQANLGASYYFGRNQLGEYRSFVIVTDSILCADYAKAYLSPSFLAFKLERACKGRLIIDLERTQLGTELERHWCN